MPRWRAGELWTNLLVSHVSLVAHKHDGEEPGPNNTTPDVGVRPAVHGATPLEDQEQAYQACRY